MALYAVNLGEAAGELLPKDVLAEIYVLSAMVYKTMSPTKPELLMVNYFFQTQLIMHVLLPWVILFLMKLHQLCTEHITVDEPCGKLCL